MATDRDAWSRHSVLKAWQHSLLVALGFLALLLVVGNAFVILQNRGTQEEINARHQYLQQTVGLESLYRDIVKALAELGVKNNDPQLLQLLASQGINVSVTPVAPSHAAPPVVPAPPAGTKR